MRILKVLDVYIDKVGYHKNTRFNITFEDGTKLSKLLEYKKNMIDYCLLSRVFLSKGNLDDVVNSILVFDTINNDQYINLGYNSLATTIYKEIKEIVKAEKYVGCGDHYFDVIKYYAKNKDSKVYSLGNMCITKAFQSTIFYNEIHHNKETINPFTINSIFNKYYKDLYIKRVNYTNTVISEIKIDGGQIIESYNWHIEKHIKFVTEKRTNVLVNTGMSISSAIEKSKEIQEKKEYYKTLI